MPVKNTGDEATRTAKMVAATSIQLLRRTAARMPSGTAITSASRNDRPESFTVSGRRSTISVVTSVRWR